VLPGTYAAVDLRCHYERLAICNEVLLVRREKNGEFRISRHDQNALDDEMLLEMCKRKDRAHIESAAAAPSTSAVHVDELTDQQVEEALHGSRPADLKLPGDGEHADP